MKGLENRKSNEINLAVFFNIIKLRWLSLLIVGVLVAAISYVYSSYFIVPQYAASAQMFIDTRRESSEGKDTYINSSHISAAKELAATYVHVMKTNTILNAVIDELNLDMSYGQLASKIGVSVVSDTQILKLTVTDDNKDRALQIAQKLVQITPTMINAKIDSGKLVSIDEPTVSGGPISPNISRNTFIGFIVGVAFLYIIFLIKSLFDNKIKSVYDIQNNLEIPVLGVIPDLETASIK